ncbi:MAG: bifunctional demethylmenaquinone methyltransferase/2-methoxy-6-polyprenyl-1,4-benzoquinol methylase UbiE [Microcystaceae cyanobacterium]
MSQTPPIPASDIQALFDRIAPVYDQFNDRLSLGQHRIWKKMAIKWCEPKQKGKGLDICCGSGDLAQLLARSVGQEGQVIGVDFSESQLAIAQQRHQQLYPHLPIKWQVGDALQLPFPDQSFDCATMGYGLRNVVDIPRCLQELYRVLKSGTKAAILDFHRPQNPLILSFQQWYLNAIVVPMAKQFELTDEYAYISPSLDRFPDGSQQVKLALSAGFAQAVHYPIAGGLMGVLVLSKA